MDYILQGFGVFLGVLAGVGVTLLTQKINECRKENQNVENLKFELGLNVRKIETWLREITKYRNAVNGDTLDQYHGYFDLARILYATANNMYLSGLLYKKLEHEQLGKLQIIFSEFSPEGQKYLNDQVLENKNNFISSKGEQNNPYSKWTKENKAKAVKNIDFWEDKFKEHKNSLEEIINKLSKK